jgi:hypothetical protein
MHGRMWIVVSSCVLALAIVWTAGHGIGIWAPAGSGDAARAAGPAIKVSIPATAFTPWKNGQSYENHGRYLIHKGPGAVGTLGNYWYSAPLYLPDGVEITRLIFHWYEQNAGAHGQLKLQRFKYGYSDYTDMAVVNSPGGNSGFGHTSTTSIAGKVVDNSHYTYGVLFYLPVSGTAGNVTRNVWGQAAIVEYEYPNAAYLPVVDK